MAEIESKAHGAGRAAGEEETPSDWQRVAAYVQENPLMVLAGAVFLLICVAAGGLFSLHNIAQDREVMTEYAAAVTEEDAGVRAGELKQVAQLDSRWRVEALYLAGEASIEAKSYDDARSAFEQIISEHPKSEYAAPAAEGLAFLDENAGKLEEALTGYKGVFEKYSDTFIGRRQPFNIARVHEALAQFAEAKEFYELQEERFPESAVAARSQQALSRLKLAHPDLFPVEDEDEHADDGHVHSDDETPAVTSEPAPAAQESPAASPSVDEAAPAADAPAAEESAPAAEAPAVEEAAPVAEAPAAEAPAAETPAAEEAAPAEEAPAPASES